MFCAPCLPGTALMDAEQRLVTAESCTGGWIAKVLTDMPGSSNWFLGGIVAYSNTLKQSLLGVLPSTLHVDEPSATRYFSFRRISLHTFATERSDS